MSEGWKPDLVIYHHPCDDGFGAAWAAWMRWGDDCEYYPTGYGKPVPDVKGKHVLIVDFSYAYDVLAMMGWAARSIVVLDHHKSAQAELARLPQFDGKSESLAECFEINHSQNIPAIAVHFDMDKSGARLAWEFCHPSVLPPRLIKLIEDRDLWRFEMPETKAFHLWLGGQGAPSFHGWENIHEMIMTKEGWSVVMMAAMAIEGYHDAIVSSIARGARVKRINNALVPVVACPGKLASDVGHLLLLEHPDAPFSATYSDKDGSRSYSLRSDDGRDDVSLVAKRYGGGGHRNAAGFEVPLM